MICFYVYIFNIGLWSDLIVFNYILFGVHKKRHVELRIYMHIEFFSFLVIEISLTTRFWNIFTSKFIPLYIITEEKMEKALSAGIIWLFILLALSLAGAGSIIYFCLRRKRQNLPHISARMSESEATVDIQEKDTHSDMQSDQTPMWSNYQKTGYKSVKSYPIFVFSYPDNSLLSSQIHSSWIYINTHIHLSKFIPKCYRVV